MVIEKYLQPLPDGRFMDIRYRYKRGTRVHILSGIYQGLTDTVESCVFQTSIDHQDERAPGYHVILQDGRVSTIRWDKLEEVSK